MEIMEKHGNYRDYVGFYQGYIGIVEKRMETIIKPGVCGLGLREGCCETHAFLPTYTTLHTTAYTAYTTTHLRLPRQT